MTRKSKSSHGAVHDHPFGIDTKRFQGLGLHPNLTTTGRTDLGPGQYDAKPHECNYKANQCSWSRRLETEEFSKYLDYRNADILQYREYRKTCVGPGWTNIPDDRLDRGITFGKEKQFKSFVKDDQPPPGTYTIKEIRKNFSELPTFEWDGLQRRFKDTAPSYQQAPNRYNIPHKKITDKVVSKRGPYDTSTGPRDGTTIKNHFAPPSFLPPDKFYNVPSDLDYLLTHKSKRACGIFPRAIRFPPKKRIVVTKDFASFLKEAGFPGPDRYDIKPALPLEWKENKYPFDSSNVHARPPFKHTIHPGPERYRARKPKCTQAPTRSWMFSSKTPREFYKIEVYGLAGV